MSKTDQSNLEPLFPRFKILYVDDEPKALKYFSRSLEPTLDVITASNAQEAITILEARGEEIGVLATDQRMPIQSGVDLLKMARARWPDIVPILVTAYADIDDVIEAINQGGIFQYVRKPWNPDKLKIKLLEALQEHNRNKFNRKLAVVNQKLEDANDLQGKFINMLTHEVRTPVNISASLAERLLSTSLDEESRECVESIKVVNDNLSNLLSNTLDYSKWTTGDLKLNVFDFKLETLLREALSPYEIQAENNGIRLSVKFELDPETILRSDSDKLSQILANLVSNAIKFTPKRGDVDVIAELIESHDSQATLKFSVKDTGEGVPAENGKRLFEPFYQSTHSKGGTGLGLHVAKQLATILGGEIGYESEPGNGSVFWFTAVMEILTNDFDRMDWIRTSANKKPAILLAEDSVLYQTFIYRLLVDEGYAVDVVENGQHAYEMAQKKTYALILMDCQMPLKNGFETAYEIRGESQNRRTPIIALTALSNSAMDREIVKAGMNDQSSKPFKIPDFLDTIHKWTDSKSKVEEA